MRKKGRRDEEGGRRKGEERRMEEGGNLKKRFPNTCALAVIGMYTCRAVGYCTTDYPAPYYSLCSDRGPPTVGSRF